MPNLRDHEMPSQLDFNQLFELLMPELDAEVYVVDPVSLNIHYASKGAIAAFNGTLGTITGITFDRLLDRPARRNLSDMLAADTAISDEAKEKLASTAAVPHGNPSEFRFKLWRTKSDPLLIAIRQHPGPAKASRPAISQSELHYQAIVSNVPGLIYQLQLDDKEKISFAYLSEGCERLLEITPHALQANPALFIGKLVPEDRSSFLDALFHSARELVALNWEGRIWSEEFQDIKWINLRSSPRRLSDTLLQWDGMMNNITQSKREKHQIEESHRLLTELSYEMEKVKEQERMRIAREIHDDLGGNLTAIKIGLASAIKKLDQAQLPGVIEKMQQLESIIDQTFEATHRIASDLRPDVLELGIVDALAWQARQFEKQIGIPCHFRANRQKKLSPDQDITLFRLCQEAMSNIAKHAQASMVNVELVFERHEVTMTVSDNGVGIMPDSLFKPNAFGLRGMSERVAALKGSFEIRPGRERGTMKIFKLPID
jgi:signal transduction histidine kinase